MITIACVLKSGGEYNAEQVRHLQLAVDRHLGLPHRFVCLSDVPVDCHRIALTQGWKGWWSKIELFRPGLFDGQVFYFDLDTVIVGELDSLFKKTIPFIMLENFWAEDRIGSGMMGWNTELIDLTSLYHRFRLASAKYMRDYTTTEKWGDQGFIRWNWPEQPERWQRSFPGKVVSYKFHVRPEGKVPQGASVVCFHGQPRPWETSLWRIDECQQDA